MFVEEKHILTEKARFDHPDQNFDRFLSISICVHPSYPGMTNLIVGPWSVRYLFCENNRSIMTTTSFILIALITLAIFFLHVFVLDTRKNNRLSRLASLAFAFMIAGIFLSRQQLVGYILLAIGLTLAVADIFHKSKANSRSDAIH